MKYGSSAMRQERPDASGERMKQDARTPDADLVSSIENGRVNLGVERAKMLGKALRCHPAVLVFPGWQMESAA